MTDNININPTYILRIMVDATVPVETSGGRWLNDVESSSSDKTVNYLFMYVNTALKLTCTK